MEENRANALQKNIGFLKWPKDGKGVKLFRRAEKIKGCKAESQHYQIVEDITGEQTEKNRG